ncbi:hypothetical protein PISMIDRAFT_25179 [Pisolithus microcarpus 441]|uniref:Uncharacterized protein n=1 Tax=Pisolithus microcarpus 441 TaxID=765257 RepID=A0A0C9Z852_9AGAM|nr:hypothetical protein PISMIDRAFT_25179 [Pisolithus microcarpus 441]
MDVHYDEAWCPVCDRQIMPKRYTVPVQQPPKEDPPRTKAAKVKGGGLAHGTGRIRPAINRSDSTASKNRSSPPSQQPLPQPSKSAPQPKLRTVIDQGPIPLYCSDDCSEVSEDSMLNEERSSSDSVPSQPSVSVRSWSYDNVRTYPVMMPPPKKEKRIITRVIDGETKEVEVEVEVTPQERRLVASNDNADRCDSEQGYPLYPGFFLQFDDGRNGNTHP